MAKRIAYTFLFSLIITLVLCTNDLIYSFYNEYYIFDFRPKYLFYPFIYFLVTSFIKRLSLRNIALGWACLGSLVQLIHYQYFGNHIQSTEFLLLSSNVSEIAESLGSELNKMILPVFTSTISFLLILFISKKFEGKGLTFKNSSLIFPIAMIIHILVGFSYIYFANGKLRNWQTRELYPRSGEHSLHTFMKSTNFLFSGIIPKRFFGNHNDYLELSTPKIVENNPKRNVILVFGESLRWDRLSLYGYSEKTTPFLDSLNTDSLVTYRKIFSGGTMTKVSFATLLNRLKYPDTNQLVDGENNLFKLAKDNGFNTSFISGQSKNEVETLIDLFRFENVDLYENRTTLKNNYNLSGSYDMDIVKYIENCKFNDNDNFILIQQRGSHSPYNYYSDDFNIFENPYDNTVSYTDSFLKRIYNYFRKVLGNDTYLIYVSDHGEFLGEDGKKGHGWIHPTIYEVPLVFLGLKRDDPFYQKAKSVRSHFELSNLICNILGYETDDPDSSTIYVNGSELDGLAGYMKVTMNGDSVTNRIIFK
ncbi:MAG: phosphoethanolamine transferase [Candidatus Delongbacteria bacterium]|nr:phosphoethanolamine transferase [Candidatus Delongbacteria bacterium]MBN2836472.1 phosphoethanolamine transferase [Candidatus Delongbacteria bacterium]